MGDYDRVLEPKGVLSRWRSGLVPGYGACKCGVIEQTIHAPVSKIPRPLPQEF